RPTKSRMALVRAFIAKAVYNMPTTQILIDRLKSDLSLRRLCGYEQLQQIPSQPTFSRANDEFSKMEIAEITHKNIIKNYLSEDIIGHISRDSTAINAREKPLKTHNEKSTIPKKRGRPKKGEVRMKEPTRLEKQSLGMTIKAMLSDLPTACNIGTKKNSKGYKTSWQGYKLHIDCSDTGIPISCVLTSASVHDSQVAIPLAQMSNSRVNSLYDLMDAAYDSPLIIEHSKSLGHVPIIDINPRKKGQKAELKLELKAKRNAGYKTSESIRYNQRSSVERVNGRLKDEFNGRMVRVKGHAKVMNHLMFGVVALTVDQLMKFLE
ncbi:MAG: transposase, partial [Proteobacteria bacterium]|nr:transposase [Pseudomonadota bacterium]